jgi:hypothetical protein
MSRMLRVYAAGSRMGFQGDIQYRAPVFAYLLGFLIEPIVYMAVWRTVAEGIVNYDVSPQIPTFAIEPDPYRGNRMVRVVLLVNNEYDERPNQTVRIQAGVTGRNTSYGYLTGRCSPTPAA